MMMDILMIPMTFLMMKQNGLIQMAMELAIMLTQMMITMVLPIRAI